MKKTLKWFRDYWYIPFFILAMILGWLIFRKRDVTPIEQTKNELEAIREGRKTKELAIKEGAGRARLELLAKYAREKKELSQKQKAKAERLKHDPVALSKFLVRAGSNR